MTSNDGAAPINSSAGTRRLDRVDKLHELKVKIPSKLCIELHAIKILEGQHVTQTVQDALQMYFADERSHDDPGDSKPPGPAGASTAVEQVDSLRPQ